MIDILYYFYYYYYIMNIHPKPKLLAIAQLNEKCQVVIPKEARDAIGIGPGDRVVLALAPFGKALVVTRPEILEEQLDKIVAMQKSAKDEIRSDLTKLKNSEQE